MLALRKMAGDAPKDDVNDNKNNNNNNLTFYVNFCRTTPYLSLHSDFDRVSVLLGVVSQLLKLWRKDSGSTGKQKTFKRDFRVFLYAQIAINVSSCVKGVTEIEILVRKH